MLDICALAPLCKFKAVDVSTGVMKSDTVCSRYALNNLKQYDAAFYLNWNTYLASRWCKDGKWKWLRGFSFVREDYCLHAWWHWAASVFHPILEIRGHSTTSQHWSSYRNLAFATMSSAVVGGCDMTLMLDFCYALNFTHPICHKN